MQEREEGLKATASMGKGQQCSPSQASHRGPGPVRTQDQGRNEWPNSSLDVAGGDDGGSDGAGVGVDDVVEATEARTSEVGSRAGGRRTATYKARATCLKSSRGSCKKLAWFVSKARASSLKSSRELCKELARPV